MSRRLTILPVLMGLAAAASSGGCGGSDGPSNATAGEVPAAPKAFNVRLSDFKINPALNVASAGKVTITARNAGKEEHEMIVVRAGAGAVNLPLKDGSVDEDILEPRVAGEISELEPRASGSKTFTLRPGNYILFCNVPGHYRQGMFARLSVR
jgi:uncharacterized cupredoxin-like copper-binding protein